MKTIFFLVIFFFTLNSCENNIDPSYSKLIIGTWAISKGRDLNCQIDENFVTILDTSLFGGCFKYSIHSDSFYVYSPNIHDTLKLKFLKLTNDSAIVINHEGKEVYIKAKKNIKACKANHNVIKKAHPTIW